MTDFEQIIYNIVKELQDKCVAEHRAPVCVSMHEINKALMEHAKIALNGFVTDGTMTWHQNVNKIPMFTIQTPKD